MSTPKEKQVMLKILEMYKNSPFLWDRNHEDYKNKHRRTNANTIMLEVYKQLDEDATIPMLTKKILNLRTNYYRELRKVKDFQENLADDREIYKPTLWYFDALCFLGDYTSENCHSHMSECCHSHQKDPLKTETFSSSISDEEGSYQNSETHSTPPIKRRKFTNPVVYKNKNNSLELAAEPSRMNNEEWEIFGKAIGLQLRDLDKTQLTIAQKIISDAIYYANFGLLTQQTYINLGSSPP